ncbi:hypothetical protein [Segatella paludivivens]|nr:hypothetical protein [Segatella paludivivens]
MLQKYSFSTEYARKSKVISIKTEINLDDKQKRRNFAALFPGDIPVVMAN